jgi:hypothetical protein
VIFDLLLILFLVVSSVGFILVRNIIVSVKKNCNTDLQRCIFFSRKSLFGQMRFLLYILSGDFRGDSDRNLVFKCIFLRYIFLFQIGVMLCAILIGICHRLGLF